MEQAVAVQMELSAISIHNFDRHSYGLAARRASKA